jgi:hypothetical protein
MNDDRQLLDEHVLRRALRLDADEIPLRLDPALIAAAARMPARGHNELVLAILVAFGGGWLWSEAFRAVLSALAATSGLDPLAALIRVVAAVAMLLAPVAEAAAHPVVPIAILTAAMVAVFFEHRGRAHAASS